MDHKGPEHHYDEVECPECGTFWQQGEIQPETVRNNCPNCDYDLRSGTGGRPYRGQPSEINSEMTERNTPLDGASKDRGGNSLQEGIFAKSIIEEAEEEAEQKTDPTEPMGLGETHPVKDNTWKPGDLTTRPARDEILGSTRHAEFKDDDEIWHQVVEDFESAENHETNEDSTGKVAAASWLEDDGFDSNVPAEHLGWDVVDVVEPDREVLEVQDKYSMPIPNGITDALHNALVELNVWVENPEENGKLRPYKEYWSVIRPKLNKESVIQIGVENSHDADIINHVARTDDSSALQKIAGPLALLAPEALAIGGEAAMASGALAGGEALAGGAAEGGLMSGVGNIMEGAMSKMPGQIANQTAQNLLGGGGSGEDQSGAEIPMEQDASYYASRQKLANFLKETDWVQQFDAQGNPMYWNDETGQWITKQQLDQQWQASGGQGEAPLSYQQQYLQWMTPEDKEKRIQESIAQAHKTGFSPYAVQFPSTGTTVDRGVETEGYQGYEALGKRDLPIPGAEGSDRPGTYLNPKAQVEDPSNPGQSLDLNELTAPTAPEGFNPTSFHYDPRTKTHEAFYDFDRPSNQLAPIPPSKTRPLPPKGDPVPPEGDPKPPLPGPEPGPDPLPPGSEGGGGLPPGAEGKGGPPEPPKGDEEDKKGPEPDGKGTQWGGYALGAGPELAKFILNNPNRNLQQKGLDLPVRDVPYFAK